MIRDNSYVFSSESVSEGHPDKMADTIADTILDHHLAFDPRARVACEVLVAHNLVVLAGEMSSRAQLDTEHIVREAIKRIGYRAEYGFDAARCQIQNHLHEQSPEIHQMAEEGAGDQGIMFGYATNETESAIPLTLYLAHSILKTLKRYRKDHPYLGPDAKSQVWVRYDKEHRPQHVEQILLSTQHTKDMDKRALEAALKKDFYPHWQSQLSPSIRSLMTDKTVSLINPNGSFHKGGPSGDTGLTGRKIIVDTYGGWGAHGGGAFSGKDPSKVDRSAAYMARYVAKHIVKAELAERVLVQLSYIIGDKTKRNLYVNTYGTAKKGFGDGDIAALVENQATYFPFSPVEIKEQLDLAKPIYAETAAYGHMGREPFSTEKRYQDANDRAITAKTKLFTWEALDTDRLNALKANAANSKRSLVRGESAS